MMSNSVISNNIKAEKNVLVLKHNHCTNCKFMKVLCVSGAEHPKEDNPDLYYLGEITGEHTQTFNI